MNRAQKSAAGAFGIFAGAVVILLGLSFVILIPANLNFERNIEEMKSSLQEYEEISQEFRDQIAAGEAKRDSLAEELDKLLIADKEITG